MTDTLNTFEFLKKFPNEDVARTFFELYRWGDKIACSHCGSVDVYECKNHNPMTYRCRNCRKHFNVRTGTVLAKSRLPLLKWLLAIHILTSSNKNIPISEMALKLDVTQKTTLFLVQRISETWMINEENE